MKEAVVLELIETSPPSDITCATSLDHGNKLISQKVDETTVL